MPEQVHAGSPATVVVANPLPTEGRLQTPAEIASAITMIVLPLILWFAPLGLEPRLQHGLALGAFVLVGWITQVIDPAITGLLGCWLAWTLKVVPFEIAFSGFATSTPWFLFGAILFGIMASKSGLARRLAFLVMARIGATYPRLLMGLIVSDFIMTIFVPSGIARVVIMAAIAIGLLEAFGVGKGSNIGRGMFLILTYTATIFDKMVIAGAASITARGLIEKGGNVEVLWSQWALAYLPCDLITIFFGWWVTMKLFPPERHMAPGGVTFLHEAVKAMGPWSAAEKRTMFLMMTAIVLWMTDFIHHIPSPMIGLGIGLVATLPRIGVLEIEDVRKANYLAVFFVATGVCMGEIFRATGALELMTTMAFGWVEPLVDNVWQSTLALYWSAFVYHFFLGDEVVMLATSMPVLMQFAQTHAADPLALGMVWTFGSGGKLFVYQSAPLVVGYSYGYFSARDMFKLGLCLTIVESLILLIVVPLYWPLIGI